MTTYPRIVPFGEGALLVELGDTPTLGENAAAHALGRALELDPPPGIEALVPGYVSLLISIDPLADADAIAAHVGRALATLPREPELLTGRLRRVPVVYGGAHGPDLEDVAARVQLDPRAVVALHAERELTVYMLGFAPGHPYIGDLPSELDPVRRLETPRVRVPRGSVGVVGRQSVIYPRSTPGGWPIIGRTPIALWDAERDPPAYFSAGDHVRFVPIPEEDWDRHSGPPPDW